MKFAYLDKKIRVHAWFGSRHAWRCRSAPGLSAAPLWRDSVLARFVLEPEKSVILRAAVPESWMPSTLRKESTSPPARLWRGCGIVHCNQKSSLALRLQSRLNARTSAEYHYADFGSAIQQRNQTANLNQNLVSQAAQLTLLSPISGVILTPRLADQQGAYLSEGSPLAEIADLSVMRVASTFRNTT